MRFVFILFSLMSLQVYGEAIMVDSLRSEMKDGQLLVFHEVEEEETLFSISKRYKSTISSIMDVNEVTDNRIEIGQILTVPFGSIEASNETVTLSTLPEGYHLVQEGETLYSISKLYDIKIRELRKLNQLESNAISPGEYLKIKEVASQEVAMVEQDSSTTDESIQIPEGFETYIVQTKETLNSIARKRNVRIGELKEWNNLDSDYIRIGQTLIVKQMRLDSIAVIDSVAVDTRLNEDGFEKIYEEGIVSIISDISTTKYLALHRSMPIGTELEVRNLMNNLVVHVKVVGKLPDTGINKDVLLRLSKPAYEKLGILDSKSRVEVSHFKK